MEWRVNNSIWESIIAILKAISNRFDKTINGNCLDEFEES